jgi:thiamine biosynthesis lipoprotein
MSAVDRRFQAMGCTIRVIIDPGRSGRSPEGAFAWARAFIAGFDRRLSRFRSDSELTRLNSDPSERVPVSPLLGGLIRAAVLAARRSRGLVDPTLGGELRAAGYSRSWPFGPPVTLADALALAPPRRSAAPRTPATWRDIDLEMKAGAVWRRSGIQLDSGGIGKGLAADMVARRLESFPRVLIDCGGDIAVDGTRVGDFPFEVGVRDPLGRDDRRRITLARGAIATSGIDRRLWRREDGTIAHHLLDPSTGDPAWTGLVAATARGRNAVEAETLAKAAFLAGPGGARGLLRELGGLLFCETGLVEAIEQ